MNDKIFYDLGYNRGKATSAFLKNTHWADAAPDVFKENNEGCTVYAFEPDTRALKQSCLSLEENPNIHLSEKAAWTADNEKIKFYLGTPAHRQGSSCLQATGQVSSKHESCIEVDTVDFSAFLMKTHTPGLRHVLKMDIEGAEYDVLPKMIDDGTINLIDDIIVEFHGARSLGYKCAKSKKDVWLYLKDWFAANDTFKSKVIWG